MESSDLFSDEDDLDENDDQLTDSAMQTFFTVAEWISAPNPREQRRFLEEHPELINASTEKILKLLLAVFSGRPDELQQVTQVSDERAVEIFERYKMLLELLGSVMGGVEFLAGSRETCSSCLKVLKAISTNEVTVEGIRAIYVNLFGGLALDIPSWLDQAIRQFFADRERVELSSRQQADSWLTFIQRASQDEQVPPEFIASLWHERAIALVRGDGDIEADSIRLAITAWDNALRVFTSDRYPLQYAQFQTYLAQAYARSGGQQRQNNTERAILAGQEALELLSPTDSPEERSEALVTLAMSHFSRADAHYSDTDCEKAIQYFQEALNFFTRAAFPERWAECQLYLGIVYELFAANGHARYHELAISYFQSALQIYTHDAFPERWAMTHMSFAFACSQRTATGKGRAQSRREALDHAMQAQEVFTCDASPEQWARLQALLGDFFAEEPGIENFSRARDYYEAALEVFTRDRYPSEWARCRDNLGKLYAGLMEERDSEQRDRAIQYFNDALQIYQRDIYPHHWASVQAHLGNVYHLRLQGEKHENIKQAIQFYTNALEVFAEDTSSSEWANIQNTLAMAYKDLAEDETVNLEQAIAACEAALQVYTRNAYPEQWAGAQQNLGMLFSQREKGVRADNLERAIQHLRAALQVFTRDEYRDEWAITQRNLGLVYAFRVQGDPADNIERAIYYNEAVLDIYSRHEFLYNWINSQIALANLYQDRIWGDKQENQEKALSFCQTALSELSRDTYSTEWASAQRILGHIYEERLTGNHTENLAHAAVCFENALQVYPLENFPEQYRLTQLALTRIRGLQGNWQAVHEAYAQARKAEDVLIRLGAGPEGQQLAIGRWREARDAGARGGFALIRLGKLEEGLMSIERGQARIMTASLALNTTDPTQITDVERRERYIQARLAYVAAQAALNSPLPARLPENERRLRDIARNQEFHRVQTDLDAVIKEIRTARDPANFLEETVNLTDILDASASGGPGHTLVYLVAAPWGGMAVAVFGDGSGRQARDSIATFDLPDLDDKTVRDLLSVDLIGEVKPAIGGYGYAQEHMGFGIFYRDWRGVSFQGRAESLQDACFMEGRVGLLNRAAQDVLHDAAVAHIVAQPLKSLKMNEFKLLVDMLNKRFLSLELQRVLETFSQAGLPKLIDWLVARGAKSLTLVPCGWLATFPLQAVSCADGRTLGEILPTSVTPNAYAMIQHRNQANGERSGVYALGNPIPNANHQSLFWSEAEALAVAKLADKQQKLGGLKVQSSAKRNWLIDALKKGVVVDAACHGRFDRHEFLRSALLLAGNQELTLADMLSHKVDLRGLRLLILSACQTASAEMEGSAANEVKSLAAGMVQAGARGILASLWPVDDRATYLLMVRFAQEWFPRMESESPAAALGRARHWLRTVTNGQLRSWEANELLPTTSEEKQEAREITTSYRPDMLDEEQLIHSEAQKGDPDERPFADPIYWAGFQVTGW